MCSAALLRTSFYTVLLQLLLLYTITITTSTQTILDVIRTLTVCVNTGNAAASTAELQQGGEGMCMKGSGVDQLAPRRGATKRRAIPSVCANQQPQSEEEAGKPNCRLVCRRRA